MRVFLRVLIATLIAIFSFSPSSSFGQCSLSVSISAGATTTFCQGNNVVLSTTTTFDTYQWQKDGVDIVGATDQNYTAIVSGSYLVNVTAVLDCGSSNTITVTVNPNPTINITPATATTFCSGGSVVLNATTGLTTYQWQKDGVNIVGATEDNYTASTSGDYSVDVTNSNGCSSSSTATTVTVNPNPTIDITPATATTFCDGGSVVLNATTGLTTYQWQKDGVDIVGATEDNYTASTSGDYSVDVTNSNGCSSSSTATTVTVNPNPTIDITPATATTFCDGGSVVLNATAGMDTYQWQKDGVDIVGATEDNYTASTSGDYSVDVTNSNGCSSSSTATTTNQLSPVLVTPVSDAANYCDGSTINLSATSITGGTGTYTTYAWTGPASFTSSDSSTSISSASATNSGVYYLTVTDDFGCTSGDETVSVTVYEPLVAIASSDTTLYCDGSIINFTGNALGGSNTGYTYEWTDNNIFTSSLQNPNISNVSAASSGTYHLIVTDDFGCISADATRDISVMGSIAVLAISDASIYCNDATITFTGDDAVGGTGNGYTYSWTGPNGFNSIDQNPIITNSTSLNSGNYEFVATDDYGCVSAPYIVTLDVSTPVVATAINASPYCDGVDINLDASASGGTIPYVYSWKDFNSDPVSSNTIFGASTIHNGIYTVTATDSNGCLGIDTMTITVLNPISVDLGNDTTYCPGTTIKINSSIFGGSGVFSTLSWNGPNGFSDNTQNVTVTNSADVIHSGVYQLQVTDDAGCISPVASVSISVNNPIIPSAGSDTTYCYGTTFNFNGDATGGSGTYTFEWTTPNATVLNDQNPEIQDATTNESGLYSLIVTDDAGCSSIQDQVTININDAINVNAGNDTTYCYGTHVVFTPLATGGTNPITYSWINPATDPLAGGEILFATPGENGDYTVTATDDLGCTSSDIVNITMLDQINVTASTDTNYCNGDAIILSASATGGSGNYAAYNWYGPNLYSINDQNPEISNADSSKVGVYNIVVTDDMGCKSDSAFTNINVYDPLLLFVSNDALCYGFDVTLSSSLTGGFGQLNYEWTTPDLSILTDENPVITGATPSDNGDYSLLVTDEHGCISNNAMTTVNVLDDITAIVGNDGTCPGTPVSFTANASGGQSPYDYFWTNSDGDTIINGILSNPTVANIGDFTLSILDNAGCVNTLPITSTLNLFETPTTEASNYTTVNIYSDSLTFDFDRGDGEGVLVLASESNPATDEPGCNITYNAQDNTSMNINDVGLSTLGNAKVIYNSMSTLSTVELNLGGLNYGTHYYFTVYEYDTSSDGISYYKVASLVGDETTSNAPSVAPSNLQFTNIWQDGVNGHFTPGNGHGRMIVLQTNDSILANVQPVDGIEYIANPVPGLGDSLTNNLYVIYSGTDTTFDLSGLDTFGLYTLGVFEYNGAGAGIVYNSVPVEKAFRTSATIASLRSKYTLQIKITNPSAEKGVLVLARPSVSISDSPTNGIDYLAPSDQNVLFDTTTAPKVGNAYALFERRNRPGFVNPSFYTINIANLIADNFYYFEVYEWDTLNNTYAYRPDLHLETKTLLGPPSTASKKIKVDSLSSTSCRIHWTNGNGLKRMVIAKERINNGGLTAIPVDSITYIGNAIFGSGDTVEKANSAPYSGTHYVIYNGTDSSVTITGLSPFTSYNFGVIEYNGADGFENYKQSYPNVTVATPGLSYTSVSPKKMSIKFTQGNGRGAIVLVKEGSPISTGPSNGVNYNGSTYYTVTSNPPTISFNNDSFSVINGAKVIYKNPYSTSAIKTFILSDLKSGTHYYLAAYEWDSDGTYYLSYNMVLSDTTTGLTVPTTAAKNIIIDNVAATSFKVHWTNGNGNNRIVVMRAMGNLNCTPQNNVIYTANSVFGSGDTVKLSNNATYSSNKNFVVYNGSDTSVTVSNLLSNTSYYVRVYEYNGVNPNMYGVASASANKKTTSNFYTLSKIGQTYAQTFDSIATNGLPDGWESTDASIDANSGATAANGVYHFGGGNYSSENRALGMIGNNSVGIKFKNSTGKTITSVLIRYKGSQWRTGAGRTIWGLGGNATLDKLRFYLSQDAYSINDPNIYLTSTPATWVIDSSLTYQNNNNATLYSLDTTILAEGTLNILNSLPTQIRGASLTGLNIPNFSTFFIKISHEGQLGDALALDSLEIVPFSNTIIGSNTINNGSFSDLNIISGIATQTLNTVNVTNAMNIENGATYDFVSSSNRNLKLYGKLYTDNDLGHGNISTGVTSSIYLYGNGTTNNIHLTPTDNIMRNLVVSTGVTANLKSTVRITGGGQYGTVSVGTSNGNATLNTNGYLILKSDTTSTSAINPIYGVVNGDVNVERAMTYAAGNRLMGHPFSEDISLNMVNDNIALEVTGGSQNIWYFDGSLTAISTASSFLSSSSYRDFANLSSLWATTSVARVYKAVGANTVDFTGPINQGTKTITLNGTSGSLVLVPNPYPSGVKLTNPLNTATNIGDTVWTYNFSTNSFKARASSSWSSLSIPMCAVFAVRLTAASAAITFVESDKLASPNATASFKPEGDDDDDGSNAGNSNTLSNLSGNGSDGSLVLSVSPNPAVDFINLVMNGKDVKAVVRIINVTGQVMNSTEIPTVQHSQLTIPVNNLPMGMYTIEVITDNDKISQQFIKL